MLDKHLLDILVCPRCRRQIEVVEDGGALLCRACELKYPVRDGIPHMIVDEAIDLKKGSRGDEISSGSEPAKTFKVIEGANKGMIFHLEMGTCKAIGRPLSDSGNTLQLSTDLSLTLDESTKGLVHKYITKQFKNAAKGAVSDLGSFRRTSDIILDDTSVSRLHAMIFYDSVGVGILDLVSKNGTFVNGDEVESRLLKKGDVVEIGESRIVYSE